MNSFRDRLSVMVYVLDGARRMTCSIDVALIAAGPQQLGELCLAGFDRLVLGLSQDARQGSVHVAAEALFIAAEIDVGTVGDPAADLVTLCPETILHIDLLRLVAREGHVDLSERAGLQMLLPLKLIEEVVGVVACAEKEPARR